MLFFKETKQSHHRGQHKMNDADSVCGNVAKYEEQETEVRGPAFGPKSGMVVKRR